ncbi:MAG: ABC transporter ATP-binding protein [Coprococcus sp.]
MIEVKNVYKSYNKFEALKDISISVKPGEICGLIGENSAGKTTLIKCMAGIYKTNQGSITYDGKAVYNNPEVKEKLGYVADSNDYIGFYTVAKMVYMYETFYSGFEKEKFNYLNKTMQVPVDKRVMTLSKGQKMKLAFMLELSKNPNYLIMDEPTSGLDPVAKSHFYDILVQEVERHDIGVLISSHNLDGLEKICDSIVMMHQGTVEQQTSLDGMKDELVKLQVVFENGAPDELKNLPEILEIHNIGSIYTMIVQNYDNAFIQTLHKLGASFIETIDLSL